jgi:hypothetical protein
LAKVVSELADDNKIKKHISYRDSKLTLLLKDSLGGGHAYTLIIACISLDPKHFEDTKRTLDFASSAKSIKAVKIMKTLKLNESNEGK